MDDETPNLSLPYILPSQAQKHVTHNEAIRRLDVLTQMSAASRTLSEPPEMIENGTVFIIPDDASGVWTGRAGQIAAFQDNAFVYFTPKPGWRVYVTDERLFCFDGANWVSHAHTATMTTAINLDNVPRLGVNGTADDQNRLLVQSDSILFNHNGGDMRTILNKQTSGNTGSFLFQTNFSGRAEIGLTGDDNFHFNVSPDGKQFKQGLVLDSQTGHADFPNGFSDHGVLSETRTALSSLAPILTGPRRTSFDRVLKRLEWQGRLVVICAGNGSHFATDGLFEIKQPDSGTLINGFGGAADDTSTDAGILLGSWEALYYVLPVGGDRNSRPNHFRRVSFRGNFQFPPNELWVFIALHNGDTGEIRLGNGKTIEP